MSYLDTIYEFAVDNHYLISTAQAAALDVPPVELAKLAHRGKLENLCRGLYRLARWVPSNSYEYAEAVARVSDEAYLYGESVIALLGLAPTNPAYVLVAAPTRVRKALPESIRVKKPAPGDTLAIYEGVACQHITCALRAALDSMPKDRVEAAAREAHTQGYLLKREYEQLKSELGWQ
jgi:predicted transcriptional regulator of viral defense system